MSETEPDDDVENGAIDELVEKIADYTQNEPERIRSMMDGMMGLTPDDVSEEDAEALLAAWDDREPGTFGEVAAEYGVDEMEAASFVATLWEQMGEEVEWGNEEASSVESRDSGRQNGSKPAGGGGVSRDEVERIVDEKVDRVSDEVVSKLKRELSGGGGGGGGGQPSQQQNDGSQMQSMLAQAIVQNALGGGGGSGLEAQIQEQATQNFVRKAFTPDPGEIMGRMMAMQQYRKMAEEMGMDVDDGMMQKQMKSMFESPIYGAESDDDDE